MATFFCPRCWSEVAPDAACCPSCSADLAELDQASFDEKLVRAHPYLAAEIATALGRIGTDEALTTLERLAAAPSVVVRTAAREALAEARRPDE